jgi:hypothetical protein
MLTNRRIGIDRGGWWSTGGGFERDRESEWRVGLILLL